MLTLLLILTPSVAVAQSAAEILQKVDSVASSAADFSAKIELTTKEASGKETSRDILVWQKGDHKRMLKVTSPPRLKGVGLLATDEDQFYLYLPSFGRVRRVAGQRRGQPFLSSNFTQDDMVRIGYAKRFSPKLKSQDKDSWTLTLTPKKPDDEPYSSLTLKVRKADHVVSLVEFYKGTKLARRLTATDVKVVQKTPLAHKIVAEDLEAKSTSTAVLSDVKTDTGLKDDFFSKRYLKRKK